MFNFICTIVFYAKYVKKKYELQSNVHEFNKKTHNHRHRPLLSFKTIDWRCESVRENRRLPYQTRQNGNTQ